ncbi:MAG: hypothetical protein ACPGNT_10175, partial [Rhodospirillales bacterium]
ACFDALGHGVLAAYRVPRAVLSTLYAPACTQAAADRSGPGDGSSVMSCSNAGWPGTRHQAPNRSK